MPSRRTVDSDSGGVEIAFVGIDGSGKSTYAESVRDWLSWKVDVYPVYFGSGDGRSSLLRYPLKQTNKIRKWMKSRQPTEETKHVRPNDDRVGGDMGASRDGENLEVENSGIGPVKAVWAILLAREKRKKRKRAKNAKNRGMIVLMDRYPQSQFPGYNDGPLMTPWEESHYQILEQLAEWEATIYEELHQSPPDLLIKLQTTPETAKRRKPETPSAELDRKETVIEELEYDDSTVEIDTEREQDEVHRQIKETIWEHI
jgi:thymidylate kinase